MRRALKIYLLFFLQFVKARLAYKADMAASLVGSAAASLSGILFVVLLIDGKTVTGLHGWGRSEVLFIYGYSFLSTALFLIVGPNLFRFGDRYVIQGQFDRVLLRPLGTLAQVLFESFSLESAANAVVGLAVLWYAKGELGLSFSAADWLWLAVSCISGAVILLSVFVVVSSLSFHFEDRLGISAPIYNLISFSRYPLPVFNRVIQAILSFIVPFGFAAFYPATHFFSREGFALLCYLTPVVAVVTWALAMLAWRIGVARYASAGS